MNVWEQIQRNMDKRQQDRRETYAQIEKLRAQGLMSLVVLWEKFV